MGVDMITIRRGEERGRTQREWLVSMHSFSFGDYHDPQHMGFGNLRVINEDNVLPVTGFPTHSHRDMEIISYVLAGSLQHQDSLGNGSIIKPGDVQRMSAGTGVSHSEYNPSHIDPVHFLQIWILPRERGLSPSYEQKGFTVPQRRGRLHLVASPDGRDGSVTVHQDAYMYAGLFGTGEDAVHELAPGRKAYVQVARGTATINGHTLSAGDGAAIEDERRVTVACEDVAELLLFDV